MIKYRQIISGFLFFTSLTLSFAQQHTVTGYISDINSGETMINAAVLDALSKKGVVTNTYGFYSITIPRGKVQLSYSYVGYTPQNIDFTLTRDTVINIKLHENTSLQQITVTGGMKQEFGVQGAQMSAINVNIDQIKTIPMIFGETDLLKALQLLPGVQSGTEGSAGFYVRGGGPDENLFLLDGVPLYNVNHAAGFFSAFNTDAIKSVTLYKGGFPARFGGRLSSVIDVRMNDGNNRKIKGNLQVGLISAKMNVEGPLFSDKTTFNVSYRRTYFDLLTKPLMWIMQSQQDMDKLDAGYYFYDLNAKISHKFDDKNRLYASFYSGDDGIYANIKESSKDYDYISKVNMKWGNLLGVLRWNRVLNSKLFMDVTVNYTRYRLTSGIGYEETDRSTDPAFTAYNSRIDIDQNSGIDDYSARVEFDYSPHPDHDVKFGINPILHTFSPMTLASKVKEDSIQLETSFGGDDIKAFEFSVYAEDNFALNSFIKINAGLHYSGFNVQGRFYNSLQPRLSGRMLLTDNFSLKAGYAAMTQYIHLLSNNSISLPTDLWVPVTRRITPMNSHQVSIGAFYNFKNILDFSVEGYYKSMNNLIEYKDGASFLSLNANWEDKVAMGSGRAYGMEFLVQKTMGSTTGWIGYTLSKAERLFDREGEELNFGKVFPAKYDRRHDVNIVVSHKFSKKIDISGTWVFSSGNCTTLALQEFPNPFDTGKYYNYHSFNKYSYYSGSGNDLPHIEKRNNYRLPAYHRLDLGINFHKKVKYGTRTWNISFYNAYNSMNPFLLMVGADYDIFGNGNGELSLLKVTLFPIIPSVSYTYRFE